MPLPAVPAKPQTFRVTLWSKGAAASDRAALPFCAAFATDAFDGEVAYSVRSMLADDGARLVVFSGALHGIAREAAAQTVLSDYARRGLDAIRDLNGSFALLLVDSAANVIVLATDRLNSVKLLASESAERIVVSNDLRLHALRGAKLDPIGIAAYLVNGFTTADRTPFADIHILESGSFYRPRGARLERQAYWDYLPVNTPIEAASAARLVGQLEEAVIEAVRVRLRDGHATLLSLTSGYDSRTVMGVLAERLGIRDVQPFTYAYGPSQLGSEEDLAQQMAAMVGYPHRTLQSFHGSAVNTLVQSGHFGGGLADACDEVDAWQTLAAEHPNRPVLFTGDSVMIRSDLELRSTDDALIAAHILDFSAARWVEPFLGATRMREWTEATRADLNGAIRQLAPETDLYILRERLRFQYRDSRQLMTWREYFAGRWFEVVQPLMDTRVLELVMNAPLSLRRYKTLYMRTSMQMFPDLFVLPRGKLITYATYWPETFVRQRADIRDWITSWASPLDDVLEPDVLLALLDSDLTAHTRVNSALIRQAKKVYYFLQGVSPRLTALTGLTIVRPTVPAAQLLKRALVLRAFLQAVD